MDSSNIEDKNFERVRLIAETKYKSIGEVRCPYFDDKVSFNSKGLEHLKFKSKRKVRERADAYMRLKNLKLAPEILKRSHTLQEKHSRKIFVEVKTNSRHEFILKECHYYGFIAIIKDGNLQKRLKVIVKKVEGGEKHFWSIIPYWKSNREIRLHSGNPEED
jgi:hypothetical protein